MIRRHRIDLPGRSALGRIGVVLGLIVALLLVLPAPAAANAIRNLGGFDDNILPPNDDGSAGPVPIGFEINFFGIRHTELFVNNNGNVTFDTSLFTFTPFDLTSTQVQIIAPYFADVDTNGTGTVTFGNNTVNGRPAFGVTWSAVGYFFQASDKLNSFQVILIDRADTGEGNFDIEFNYDQIQWETGEASQGIGGLGGFSARVGYSNGTGDEGTFFELAGSAVNGAFLDSNRSTGLTRNSLNSGIVGRYVFESRDGALLPPVPEDDFFEMLEGDTLHGNVVTNDELPTGLMRAELDSTDPVDNGSISFNSDGSFDYTPSRAGLETFSYRLIDTQGVPSDSPGTVSINVRVDPTRATIVIIDTGQSLDSQIDSAVAMANTGPASVRVLFPPGSYAYTGGMVNGSFATPVTGSITFEAQTPGSSVTVRGRGAGNGRWLSVNGGNAEIRGLTLENFSATGSGSGGVVNVTGGKLLVDRAALVANSAPSGRGGAIRAGAGTRVTVTGSSFDNNTAGPGGGAIHAQVGSNLQVAASFFNANQATSGDGGALSLTGSGGGNGCNTASCALIADVKTSEFNDNLADRGGAVDIDIDGGTPLDTVVFNDVVFDGNSARVTGCDFSIVDSRSPVRKDIVVIQDSSLSGNCSSTRIDNPQGGVTLTDSTLVHDGNAIDSSGAVDLSGTVLVASDLVTGKRAGKDACNIQGSGLFTSLGFNLNSDTSCGLDDETDQNAIDPMVTRGPKPGRFDLLPDSPAIDAALADLSGLVLRNGKRTLPCGYKDANGLGRPQDGDGDGTFECDIGNTETKGGPDLVAGHSSAYFDPDRNGEGIFVEMLGGNLAFVAMFTYPAAGEGLAWFVGIGLVVGNSVVVDDLLQTSGGFFGDDFDPTRILRTKVGSMGFNFPTCEAVNRSGRLAFQGSLRSSYQDLLANTSRLSTIVGCDGTVPAQSGRSGSFYDPARDGEGIFVQWLDDGRVLVIWYTYDPDGNQFWTISSEATVNGSQVTATMIYPSATTNFGDGFDSGELEFQQWGTVTLDYEDCQNLTFSYDSDVEGFGSGSLDYQRLTTLMGTDCDL